MKWLILFVLIFGVNQILQNFGIRTNFTSSFLDDVLFFPIVFSINTIYQRRKNVEYKLPIYHSIICLVVIILLFEFLLPMFNKKLTADYLDALFYAVGILIYYLTAD